MKKEIENVIRNHKRSASENKTLKDGEEQEF